MTDKTKSPTPGKNNSLECFVSYRIIMHAVYLSSRSNILQNSITQFLNGWACGHPLQSPNISWEIPPCATRLESEKLRTYSLDHVQALSILTRAIHT